MHRDRGLFMNTEFLVLLRNLPSIYYSKISVRMFVLLVSDNIFLTTLDGNFRIFTRDTNVSILLDKLYRLRSNVLFAAQSSLFER